MTTDAGLLGDPPLEPAAPARTRVDGVDVVGSLSPSRAGDFLTCPLLYRFRTVDRLPEPPSPAAVRGTVVHRVLEQLFDLPADDRTPERAVALLEPAWEELLAAEPELAALFADPDADADPDPDPDANGAEQDQTEAAEAWLESGRAALGRYFTLEDPRRLEPDAREVYVESVLDSRLLLRGYVDRIDVAPDGAMRIVDYKTGSSPGERYEAKALFQLRFYALVLWRTRGVVPSVLQLVYLGNGEILRYEPDEADLLATERKVEAVWRAISTARETGDWQPSPGGLCRFCAHQALCPAYGGTPPPLPVPPVPVSPAAPTP